jgi:NAD(P)-dependent dehydrogenase (short-subunit alcohol dehydrogenase family)
MNRLQGKIAAITGAGSGIGRVAARIFASEGANVLILELNRENAEETARLIRADGGAAVACPLDISREDEVRETFSRIDGQFGGLDVLYNNASVFWGKKDAPLDVLDMSVFERIVRINLFGLVYCSKYAVPLMKKRGGGSIINTGSSAAVIGIPKCDSYTAAKGGTVSLTRSMAVEFGPFNIRTNCICPAAIATPMVVESNLSDPDFDERAFLDHGTPLRRWGKPEEVARAALFLASDDASYLNGAVFTADGGITVS